MLEKSKIIKAAERINEHIIRTPIIKSDYLNNILGHEIYFKAENLQVSGSFKVRGVLNSILELKEEGRLPRKFVAYSSGNHAHALAWAKNHFNDKFQAEIYMQANTPAIKQKAVEKYGAKLVLTETRAEAEFLAKKEGEREGSYFLHPSDNEMVLAGASTLAKEALEEIDNLDSVFASIGGGGLISGCFMSSNYFYTGKKPMVIGAEPKIANDAFISFNSGSIYRFKESPNTIADGVRSLGLSERTFKYIKNIHKIIEVSEKDIIYWTAWLEHLLNISCEPTASLSMAAAFRWLKEQDTPQKILVMISGGNVDRDTIQKTWKHDHLASEPRF